MARLIAADFAAVGVEVTASVAINDGQPNYRGEVTEALASQPDVLVLDEPVSALDVAIQAQLLNLFR